MSMYAQFSNEPEQSALELEGTTAQVDASAIAESAEVRIPTKPNVSPVASQTTGGSRKRFMNKSTIIIAAVLGIVFWFTVANFALLMQTRSDAYFQAKVKYAILSMSRIDKAKIQGLCALTYRDKCFFAIHRSELEFSDARRLCVSKNATLANVYSKRHFERIGAYLQRTRVGPGDKAWVGMTYNVTEDRIFWSDGDEITYDEQWFMERYPKKDKEMDKMAIHYGFAAGMRGFINTKPTTKLHGVVCEVK